MEVKVDPMLFLQCSLDEDDCSSETLSDSDNISIKLHDGKGNEFVDEINKSKRFDVVSTHQSNMWKYLSRNRILQNNHKNVKIEEVDDKEKAKRNLEQNSTSSEGESTENNNVLRYKCPICSKIISTKGNLKVHLETHRPKGKYACDICGRV